MPVSIRPIRSTRASCGLLVALLITGCASLESDLHKYEKPLVAVASFENNVQFPLRWQLGDGIAEILTDSLYQTGHFRVLDRDDIDAVLFEQDLQAGGKTRPEQRVRLNRLKNAHFLITGVVTEFSHVLMSGLDFGFGSVRIFGGGNHAVVNIALKMTEVESGEVVFTRVIGGKAYAGNVEFEAEYKGVSLGGYQFFRTPLGTALQKALDVAVSEITDSIGRRPWRPSIAAVDDAGAITLSGGADRHLRVGSRWIARERGEPIIDPLTGDILGHGGGKVVATLRVTEVLDRYSRGVVETGDRLERGMRLEPAGDEAPPPSPGTATQRR